MTKLSDIEDKYVRGIIKAAETGSHIIGIKRSAKKKDTSDKWAEEVQRLIEEEMKSRGLPVDKEKIDKMIDLVKRVYIHGKDAVMDEACAKLGKQYFDIFQKRIDQLIGEYKKIRSSRDEDLIDGAASKRLIERIRQGGYSKRVELALRPREEIRNNISARYIKGFAPYYSKYELIKSALAEAPSYARGLLWNATLRLDKLVRNNKVSDAKAEYMTYKNELKKLKADGYLDHVLKIVGIYDVIVGGTARGCGAGGVVL